MLAVGWHFLLSLLGRFAHIFKDTDLSVAWPWSHHVGSEQGPGGCRRRRQEGRHVEQKPKGRQELHSGLGLGVSRLLPGTLVEDWKTPTDRWADFQL